MARTLWLCGALLLQSSANVLDADNQPHCHALDLPGAKSPDYIEFRSAGGHRRCANIIRQAAPRSAKEGPLPIVVWFHSAGGSASSPHCVELGRLGLELGFAVVCPEALQEILATGGGYWALPEIVTDETGNDCSTDRDTPTGHDLAFVQQLLNILREHPSEYDMKRIFFAGCSMGSQYSMFASTCLKQWAPGSISAFATHSSGLKVKGDQLKFPADIYHPQYDWGECPECHYAPIKPMRYSDEPGQGLKACIFDNVDDSPHFYWSSMQLAEAWYAHGNKVELHVQDHGGHCEMIDFRKIVTCLDDGTGALVPQQGSF